MKVSLKTPHRVRQWIRRIHFALAFTVGLVLVVSGVSGSLLVFHPEIDRSLNPGLWQVEVQDGPQSIDASLEAVREAYPGDPIRFARLPRQPEDALEVGIGAASLRKVYVDPYTAQMIGSRGEHEGLMGTLHDLHVHLLAGETGETVMGAIGLVALVLLGTGLTLWWPRGGRWSGAFRVGWKETGARKVFRLHRFIGIVSIGFLILSILTGAGLVFHETTNAMLKGVLGGPMRAQVSKLDPPWPNPSLSAGQLVQHAQTLLPEATPTWIRLPASHAAPFVVRMRFAENPHPNGSTYIALHPQEGRALTAHSFRESGRGQIVSDMKYPLHIGRFWGEGGRIITVLIGLSPALLFASGFIFWRTRRSQQSKPKRDQASFGPVAQRVDKTGF